MTRLQFEDAIERLDTDKINLAKVEALLQEMVESEHAPGLRPELQAAKQAVHTARLTLLVAYQRCRHAVAVTKG